MRLVIAFLLTIAYFSCGAFKFGRIASRSTNSFSELAYAKCKSFASNNDHEMQPRRMSLKMVALSEKKAKIPLKIGVIGGGVGGTMLGYALQQKGFEVTVFEKTAKFSRFGGPIQLASNALSCIDALSPSLFEQIMKRFTFTGNRKCGIKDGIRNRWYSIFDAIPRLAEANSLPYTGVIDRPDLQEILLNNLHEGSVINNKGLSHYEEILTDDGNSQINLYFQDGSNEKGFDIVVGADGIWSAVRRQMWQEASEKPGTCTYSGYTLFAAETVMDPKSPFFASEGYFDAGYKVYIGPGKYFVTSDVGSGRIQWYAFLALPPGTKARSSNVNFLQEQFTGWNDEIHACLINTPESIIEQRDLYDRRPSVLRSWSKGHVTMLGDAVHPMMPNLGQGGCQAIEDAFVLTEILTDVTDRSEIEDALQQYYRQRIVRSAIVQGLSRLSSDIIISSFTTPFDWQEFLQAGLSYKYLTVQSLLTNYLQTILPMIFYIQFGYLYSYAPSVFDPKKVKELVVNSLQRNQQEVEKIYTHLKEGYVTYFTAKQMCFMHFNKQTREISKIMDATDLRQQALASSSPSPITPTAAEGAGPVTA
jgi:zeaxanthin epoxidase